MERESGSRCLVMGSRLRRSETATWATRPVTGPTSPPAALELETASRSMLEPGAIVPGRQNDIVSLLMREMGC